MKNILIIAFILGKILMAEQININGINIPTITEQYTKSPIINIDIIFKNSGSINDKIPTTTSLATSLLNMGTSIHPFSKFHQLLEQKAIELSISHGMELLYFSLSCLKEDMPYALKLLKELFDNPNYSKEAYKKSQHQAIDTILNIQNNFDSLANKELDKIIFKNTPLAYGNYSNKKDVQKITLKNIKESIKNKLTLSNAIVLISGDFGDLDIKNVKKHYHLCQKEKNPRFQDMRQNTKKI